MRVSGFRGADDVALDRLGRLNILAGRNNTGKSSCLEAISLLSSGPHRFRNTFGENTLEKILGRRVGTDECWRRLVHDGAKSAVVEGARSGATETLEIARSPHDMEDPPPAEQAEELESRIRGRVPGLKDSPRRGVYAYYRGDARVLGGLFPVDGGVVSETIPSVRPGVRAAGPNLFIVRPEDVPEGRCERAAGPGKMSDVISRLKTKVPDIDGMRHVNGEICVFFKDRDSMPLSLMGDGFRAAALLSMASHLMEGGTMAVEEPESRMHPALLYHVVSELLRGCRDNDGQVFLATHSDDLAECAIEAAPSKEYVSVFQLTKIDGKIDVESFDTDEAYEHRIKLGLDMRGM